MKKSLLTLALTFTAITFSLAARAQAQTLTSLYSFCSQTNCADGDGATAPLVQGTDGNLYGETVFGGNIATGYCGSAGCGTIFKMTTQGKFTTLYTFCLSSVCADGAGPSGGLVLANDGNFYGLTDGGGANNWGTVFKITPAGKLTTLHNFDYTDGWPQGVGLIQAANGSFYGTTYFGGAYGQGTLFEISPGGTFTSLYSFCANSGCPDGDLPNGLTQGTDGNIYGTTSGGGVTGNCNTASTSGTFFQLTPAGTLTTLAVFCRLSGFHPNSPLVQAANGNFYSTTGQGGVSTQTDQGTVYEMTPTGSITTLYSFCLQTDCPDGKTPIGIALGTDGNFYGTTELANADYKGTIFEITPAGQLTTLHTFTPTNGNFLGGSYAIGPMLLHTNGIFYGLTGLGGKHGIGTVFSFATGLQPFVRTIPTSGAAGTNVIILGNNLTGATAVTFNGKAAKFKVVSASEITATVPSGVTSGTVTVTASSGKKLKSNTTFRVP
ncbi:MAG TPA: choice-of-anchor tandem repeat GloVer-containing protein [Candidatus Sulfotelmatobacter sp.]|jgi:uncharacterized repeat protein (TIGR03803 family)